MLFKLTQKQTTRGEMNLVKQKTSRLFMLKHEDTKTGKQNQGLNLNRERTKQKNDTQGGGLTQTHINTDTLRGTQRTKTQGEPKRERNQTGNIKNLKQTNLRLL